MLIRLLVYYTARYGLFVLHDPRYLAIDKRRYLHFILMTTRVLDIDSCARPSSPSALETILFHILVSEIRLTLLW